MNLKLSNLLVLTASLLLATAAVGCEAGVAAGGSGTLAVTDISPSVGRFGETTTVSITGSGFEPGISVRIGATGIGVTDLTGDSLIEALVPDTLDIGTYTLIVVNPDDSTASLVGAFEVTADGAATGGTGDGGGATDTGGGGTDCDDSNEFFEKGCIDNEVFWFDECGTPTTSVELCDGLGEVCNNGGCGAGDCPPNVQKKCDGQSIYWYDGCDIKGDFVESCDAGSFCSGGECSEACQPHFEEQCVGADVFWFDSCGVQESLAEKCDGDDFCINANCIKPTYAGSWFVNADPPVKTTGLGTVTFQASTMVLATTDGTTTLTDTPPGQAPIVYSGAIANKVFTGQTSYSIDVAGVGIHIDATIFITFTAGDNLVGVLPPTDFTGTLQEDMTADGLGSLGNTVWQIFGVRQ